MKRINEGMFSMDRPRIPGDPPHLEIFTKVGHALPNTIRKTLAASAYLGKGRIKDAVRVMKRKGNLPKLKEEYEKEKAKDILPDSECKKMKADKKDLHKRMRKLAKQEVKKHEDSKLHETAQLDELYGKGSLEKIYKHWNKKREDKQNQYNRTSLSSSRPWTQKDSKEQKKINSKVDRADSLLRQRDYRKYNKSTNEDEQINEALFRGGSKKGRVHPLRLSPLSPEEQEKRRKAKKTNDDDYQKAIDRENEGEDLGTRPKKGYFEEGRTAGEDIDARISRNIERADHHTTEYMANKKGPMAGEHIQKADRHTALVSRLKRFKQTGKIHEESIEESFFGQVTRLKKWIKGRQRAKDASNKWTAASSKEQYNSQSYDRRGKNEYWEHRRSERDMERNAKSKSPAKRAQASSDKVRSDYHRDQWLKNAAKSGRARRKSDKLANYGWDAVNDHKKLPKFGRKKLEEGVVRKIKRALTSWKTKQDLEDKMSKESDKIDKKYNPFKLTRQERLQKDPARTKAYERLVTLGKRQSAMTGGNIFMPSWPKKPGDLKYMSKKKLEEAVSRKLIAKKNAEKQRTKYVVRKGEMPPIMSPKNRYKFSGKELSKLKGILDKQQKQRSEVKAITADVRSQKKLAAKLKNAATKVNVPDTPESSRASSVSVFSKLPSPGGHIHNAQPHVTDLVRAHQGKTPEKKKDADGDLLRGFNTWTNEFARTGDAKYLDSAKRAALTHYASMIAKISHHPGHPEYDTARSNAKSMLDAHLDAIGQLRATIPAVPRPMSGSKPINRKTGILSKLKKLFKENNEV